MFLCQNEREKCLCLKQKDIDQNYLILMRIQITAITERIIASSYCLDL